MNQVRLQVEKSGCQSMSLSFSFLEACILNESVLLFPSSSTWWWSSSWEQRQQLFMWEIISPTSKINENRSETKIMSFFVEYQESCMNTSNRLRLWCFESFCECSLIRETLIRTHTEKRYWSLSKRCSSTHRTSQEQRTYETWCAIFWFRSRRSSNKGKADNIWLPWKVYCSSFIPFFGRRSLRKRPTGDPASNWGIGHSFGWFHPQIALLLHWQPFWSTWVSMSCICLVSRSLSYDTTWYHCCLHFCFSRRLLTLSTTLFKGYFYQNHGRSIPFEQLNGREWHALLESSKWQTCSSTSPPKTGKGTSGWSPSSSSRVIRGWQWLHGWSRPSPRLWTD